MRGRQVAGRRLNDRIKIGCDRQNWQNKESRLDGGDFRTNPTFGG